MAEPVPTESVVPALVIDPITAASAGCLAARAPLETDNNSDQQQHTVEPLESDETNTSVRPKLRTCLIIAALYSVLFIAALDQTIVA